MYGIEKRLINAVSRLIVKRIGKLRLSTLKPKNPIGAQVYNS